ncbi:hypothetical protein DFA_08781 [Cavenderia fasciculata]|uniref:Uncharacterized protein n=1 Tax=Cavenderia fasciculata TaxID=261658 RepID=F4Q479_CACFS|nr:uncharacterized protein DFA_08781 [Cavenderia fasciculata]EGG17781.1 hypothetical protein DFA_08781 [Cavenderia fasciculata]|eukprot:XP_004356265.1 hypothetical protein DFA_08781 [Cavenderia fasciculata]
MDQFFLPLYIQATIINKLVIYSYTHICTLRTPYDFLDWKYSRAPFYGGQCWSASSDHVASYSDICKLLYTGELPVRQHNRHSDMIDLALVSKWWFQVIRKIKAEINVVGRFDKDRLIRLVNVYSIHQACNIKRINWNTCLEIVDNDDDADDGDYYNGNNDRTDQLDYKQVLDQLPQLDTINIITSGTRLESISKIMNEVIAAAGRQLETTMLLEIGSLEKAIKINMHGFVPNHSTVVSLIIAMKYHSAEILELLGNLKPSYLNLFRDEDYASHHLQYSKMFGVLEHTKHISMDDDYLELPELYQLLTQPNSNLESFETSIILIPTRNRQGGFIQSYSHHLLNHEDEVEDEDEEDEDEDVEDEDVGMTEWDYVCEAIECNTTLKLLFLKDYNNQSHHGTPLDPIQTIPAFEMPFELIWETNKTIEYLGMSYFSHVISPQFFASLSYNRTITTLVLTQKTIHPLYVPEFSTMIAISTTIKTLSIADKYLEWCDQLQYAFQQNKSIKVLDVSGNSFDKIGTSHLFDALLHSDTVHYLVVDGSWERPYFKYNQHRYFQQSKSLKDYACRECFYSNYSSFLSPSLFQL